MNVPTQLLDPGRRSSRARPAERLFDLLPEALTERELLGFVLAEGPSRATVELAVRRLLGAGAERLLHARPARLRRWAGLTQAQAVRLCAAVELGRRLAASQALAGEPVAGPGDAARILVPHLRHQRRELFAILPLDAKGRGRRPRVVSVGSLSASIVHPREVFHEAIAEAAASIVLAHNHPSGDPSPSPEDVAVTRKLVLAGEILGIPVVDHLIVGAKGVSSLKELGLMGEIASG